MAKIEVEKELVERHSDEELVAFLYKTMAGVVQNFQTTLKANQPESLWSNFGDIAMVASILKNMKQRNDAIEAKKQSMV